MPNWCFNTLKIKGEPKEIEEFLEKAKGEQKISLEKLVPIPPEQAEDWYKWNLANWGTKWDLCEVSLMTNEIKNGKIEAMFDTAWGPPIQAFQTIAEKYPELEFHMNYSEPGMGFRGAMKWKNGEEFLNNHFDDHA